MASVKALPGRSIGQHERRAAFKSALRAANDRFVGALSRESFGFATYASCANSGLTIAASVLLNHPANGVRPSDRDMPCGRA